MRNEPKKERLRVASLRELDALVGRYLTRETPQVFWEEQQVCLRFDSLEEALEAMHDPYFQQFIPEEARQQSSLAEVQEFRPYSSDLTLAWEVVEQLSAELDAFRVWHEKGSWFAVFGDRQPATARSAPVAICLAALLTCGLEVEMIAERTPPAARRSSAA